MVLEVELRPGPGPRPREKIVILDFGSQYSMLIARKVRENSVYCEIIPHNTPASRVFDGNTKGVILSGGPSSVYQENAPLCDKEIFSGKVPVLGICYGMQLITYLIGGQVARAGRREYGKTEVFLDGPSRLFGDLPSPLICWMSHGDRIERLPEGFRALARTGNSPIAAMGDEAKGLYAVQFHPEVVHTPRGKDILGNFLFRVCGCSPSWTPASFIDESIRTIRAKVGNGRVVCALSGGVDSSAVAVLFHKAIGDQLTCIFVNNGLLRKGEPEMVVETFKSRFGLNLIYVDAEERFLERLKGVVDPEEKRKRIGNEFIRVFEEEARSIGRVDYLAQGTLYPDVIESTAHDTGPAARIKSHHNVGGLPEDMELDLIEPLRYLFKDEVRIVARELGLPDDIIWRQPFPGPGLAVRIIGEVTRERLGILREADAIIDEEIKKAGLYRDLWQSFAILPAMRSVGVMGDERTYAHFVVLRAVTSEDGMTCDWARLSYEVLERISNRIVNEVKDVNRVVYDITSKPPSTIEWE